VWFNPFSCSKKVTGLVATVVKITSEIFKFDGQSRLDLGASTEVDAEGVEAHRL
jgi:microcystin degradation protein MlrC